MMVAPFGLTNAGSQLYHFVPTKLDADPPECEPTCPYPRLEAKGDRTSVIFTGRHEAAEKARASRRGIRWLLPPCTILRRLLAIVGRGLHASRCGHERRPNRRGSLTRNGCCPTMACHKS